MKKKVFWKLLLIFLVIFSLLGTSCSKNEGSNYLFRYSLLEDPKNLDPQLATDTSSLVIIENMFEGLLKNTSSGNLSEGVAKSYSVSEDGLTYTFELRENAFWTAKDYSENVTAADFVFTFKRLINPATHSPYANQFLSIKNAEKINAGQLSIDNLGIKANGKYQLVIELEHPDANFLTLLTTSPAMPCNEKFFNSTKGRYGLETIDVISNGPFYLKDWLYDPYGKNNYLILRRNTTYSDVSKVYPSGLNFFIARTTDKINENYTKESTDCIVDNGFNRDLFNSKSINREYQNASSGIVFNLNNPYLKITEVRKSLSIALDRDLLSKKLPQNIKIANGIIPSGVTMLNKSFRELSAEPTLTMFNLSLSQYLWESTLTQAEKNSFNNSSIIVPKSYEYSDYLSSISDQWSDALGFYCTVEVLPDNEYKARIESGNYMMAIVKLTGDMNSPSAFLNSFRTGNKDNITKYSNQEFDSILSGAETAASHSESVSKFAQAEKFLTDNYIFTPIFYHTEYLINNKDMADIIYNPFTKQVNFTKAKKY